MPAQLHHHPVLSHEHHDVTATDNVTIKDTTSSLNVIVQFRDGGVEAGGAVCGPQMALPLNSNVSQLAQVVRSLTPSDSEQMFSFFLANEAVDSGDANIDQREITSDLESAVQTAIAASAEGREQFSLERVLSIVFQPQALFRVRSVGRCTSTLPGHTEAVLCVQFSPDGQRLATASGDTTVRVWQVDAEMPQCTLRGHQNWVQTLAWSPDARRIVSGSKNGGVIIWNAIEGCAEPRKPLKGHSKYVSSLAWRPLHIDLACSRVASASKDGTVRVWNTITGAMQVSLSGHSACVTCVRWGGTDVLYSASQDRTIKVWSPSDGRLLRTLRGHAHWVNSLSLSTDYVLRTGAFNHCGVSPQEPAEAQAAALERYQTAVGTSGERLVSCSDDFTMFLWQVSGPNESVKPVARMTGHQQPVNHLCFSPDGLRIATASFDHSIRLWDGITGKFTATLRGHVQAVYKLAWSADSRLIVSGSRDSTVKVFEVRTRKALRDLPGHADEVFSIDWSPDGKRVASGGRDRVIKFWRR